MRIDRQSRLGCIVRGCRTAVVASILVVAIGCSSSDSTTAPTEPELADEADNGSILNGLTPNTGLDSGLIGSETIAFSPNVIPIDYEITRASAASADFMSVELANDDDDSITVIWGAELTGFDEIADADEASESVQIGDSPAQLFTFSSSSGAGPAVIWQGPSDTPVLVIGSPDVEPDTVLAVADGVTETTQDEFIELAGRLALERLERDIQAELGGG